MARRIDIELTSARPDGSWTWRAAGALKPRGVLEGTLLYEGAKAGDVVRADAEFELEGITILGVLPPKEKKRSEPERLEVVGPPRESTPGVTASLTSRPDRRDREGGPRGPRGGDGGPGRGGDRAAGGGGDRAAGGGDRTGRPGSERPGRSQAGAADRPSRERAARPARDQPSRDTPHDRPTRPPRGRSDRPGGDRLSPPAPTDTSAQPKARRLNPGNSHRTAVLEALPPEQRPIAEQVLRGGIPAVRTALHLEREKATAEGRMAPNSDALLAIAEELLPRLKAAEWRDRAEAAAKVADELAIRDLRSVVAGADVARDDESRQLAVELREALERRVNAQRQEWLDDVTANLNDGRVVRALRASARPPDPGCRFPVELATRLAEVASEAMGPETPPERWAALLEAVAASPVRRSVKPSGLPSEPGEALLHAARQSSGRIPALALMLGISMPPPPGPARPIPRPPRPSGRPPRTDRPPAGRPASPAVASPPPPAAPEPLVTAPPAAARPPAGAGPAETAPSAATPPAEVETAPPAAIPPATADPDATVDSDAGMQAQGQVAQAVVPTVEESAPAAEDEAVQVEPVTPAEDKATAVEPVMPAEDQAMPVEPQTPAEAHATSLESATPAEAALLTDSIPAERSGAAEPGEVEPAPSAGEVAHHSGIEPVDAGDVAHHSGIEPVDAGDVAHHSGVDPAGYPVDDRVTVDPTPSEPSSPA